tara:strand:- start:256 stop:915 length:660 start_codon:yes stop_codon:yes gene_type:complete
MAKLKDLVKESFSLVGGVVSTPVVGSGTNTGLTDIVEDIYGQKTEKISAKEVQEAIREFSSYSKVLQKEENLQKIAERLSKIATNAKSYTVSETEDWFDKVTVNRNMKELTNLSKQFGKIAQESNSLQQRLGGLYEDMGHILGRYYEIEDNGDSQEDEKIKAGLEEPKGHDIEEGDYEAFFQKAMKKFGIKSPAELDDDKKKKFFNYVDANYKGEKETD